ncbi:hypothetical protein JTE90_003405 [Oedothorax gibbosus]|uniref:Uncharacterized protein n=1 Tax=Oedothorax gibbosus TaxID=931172 RepID=A0AAV6TYC3_9ARAC|nr:hypothetical protein JTE90_003405 [Oedothorax gibbosus]
MTNPITAIYRESDSELHLSPSHEHYPSVVRDFILPHVDFFTTLVVVAGDDDYAVDDVTEIEFHDDPINAVLVPIPPAEEGAVRSFLADFEETLRGGNGTDDIRVGGSLGELSPADFERERRIYLEEIVSRIRLAKSERGDDWSPMLLPPETRMKLEVSLLGSAHLSPASQASFSSTPFTMATTFTSSTIAPFLMEPVGAAGGSNLGSLLPLGDDWEENSIFVRNVGQASWHGILSYYVFQQEIQGPTVFLGGTKSPPSGSDCKCTTQRSWIHQRTGGSTSLWRWMWVTWRTHLSRRRFSA